MLESSRPTTGLGLTVFPAVAGRAWQGTGSETPVSTAATPADTGSVRIPSIVGSKMTPEGTVAASIVGRPPIRPVGVGGAVTGSVAVGSVVDLCPSAVLAGGQRSIAVAGGSVLIASRCASADAVVAPKTLVPPGDEQLIGQAGVPRGPGVVAPDVEAASGALSATGVPTSAVPVGRVLTVVGIGPSLGPSVRTETGTAW